MGCAQSKIENEEAVARCKERKQHMKEAVSSRNAFAAAHSAYAVSLKETGAALSEYGQAEMGPHLPSPSTAAGGPTSSAVTQPPIEHLPPPPPPLPDFSPLQRSVSMPEVISEPLRRKKNPNKEPSTPDASIREEEENDDLGESGIKGEASDASSSIPAPPRREQATPPPPPPGESSNTWDFWGMGMDPFYTSHTLGDAGEIHPEQETHTQEARYSKTSASVPATVVVPNPDLGGRLSDDIPPVTPERVVLDTPPPLPKPVKKSKQGGSVHHQHAVSAGASDAKKGKMVPSTAPAVNLVQMLTDLDDHFLKASESAQEVSKMLEATRLHYHSNFADNRGHIDHSARVMRVITWNRSFKGLPNDDGNDAFDNEESETHATILDKLLAWEKKLYDEVKAGELMKIEYQRKVAVLNKQKKRGTNQETLEKTKAAVSHLHTRYIVDMQSMDSTVSEIQRLRDDQLYPKLAALIDEMAKMWEVMHHHHDSQLKIVMDLRALDISSTPKETTQNHYQRTEQLHHAASKWHTQFQKLVSHQKEYIQALNSWLKLNLIPIESSLKEKVSSPPRIPDPPIKVLLHAWHDQLEKLPDELAKSAIHSFAAVIQAIMFQQQEELKQRDKCEGIRKELARKERAFNDWYQKYQSRRSSTDDTADQEQSESANQKDLVAEKKLVVEALQKQLEEEEENHKRLCKQVREKAVGSLKTHLPELFRAMSDFSDACSTMYKKLRVVTQMQRQAETTS